MIGSEDAGEVMITRLLLPALPGTWADLKLWAAEMGRWSRGNMEVKSADGRSVMRTRRTLLCRCGDRPTNHFATVRTT